MTPNLLRYSAPSGESNALGERLKAAEQEADKVIMDKILSDLRLKNW